ncbi:MAG TPA: DUF58 domain-containing protein, partial [Nakamurella sp.]
AAIERVRALRDAVAGVITPLGGSVIGLGALSAAVGVGLAWREADLIAVACALVLIIALGYLAGTAALTAEIEMTTNRVEAGHNARVAAGELTWAPPARAFVTVRNTGMRSSRWLTMEIPLSWQGGERIATVPIRIRPLGIGGEYRSEAFDLPTGRRGVIDLGPATVVRTDPLGLLRRAVAWSTASEFVVHPRTVAVDQTGAGLLRDLEGQTSNDLSMNDLAFHALREYEVGDSLRHVHALTSARLGRLMVRQFLDTRAAHLTVIVSGVSADYRDPAEDEFEAALSIGSSLAVRAIHDGQRVSIFAAGRGRPAPRLTHRLALDGFSRARFGTPGSGLIQLASHAIQVAPETSMAALITGAATNIAQIRAAAARFGPGVRVVAVQVDPRQEPAAQRAGRIRLLTVPELGDLRRAMQTAVYA